MDITITSGAATAPNLLARPFDPAQWLARYVELGGGYSIVGDAIWLHWLLGSNVDETAIKAHEGVLRGQPDWREAVKALIIVHAGREVVYG